MNHRYMRMPKLVTRLVAPMALLVGVFLISAPGASAAGADVYGVGGGSISLLGDKIAKFAFSGHTGPNGDFGSFRFTIEDPNFPLDVHVDVDCVNVAPFPPGAGGWMGGEVTKASPQPNAFDIEPGDRLLLAFNDFGEPSDLIPDELNAYLEFASCKSLPPSHQTPIDQGNIVVKTN